ncbi:MAG: electron transport complex subunit E [Rhodobacterales bacterium]|nr:electron transport complex subunit E [Rhodobacterales bacterium]
MADQIKNKTGFLATLQENPSTDEFIKGLWRDNPVFVQVLGMCPVLAVTNSAVNALAMGGATFFVLMASSLLVSMVRKWVPKAVRISTFIVIIATFVTVADMLLAAWVPDVHKELGAFISLIVVNCLILGRQEAFASRNPIKPALMDAAGMGLGFTFALFLLGASREVLGNGTFFGIDLFGPQFEPWVVMILPPGGFLMLGMILLFFNWMQAKKQARRAAAEGVA